MAIYVSRFKPLVSRLPPFGYYQLEASARRLCTELGTNHPGQAVQERGFSTRKTLTSNLSPKSRGLSRQTRGYLHSGPIKPLSLTMMSKAGYSTASATSSEPVIHPIFEKVTGTWQYIVADPLTLCAIIIDSVLDYDPITQAISTTAADSLLCLVKENGYTIERILETHAHADHLTAAFYIQQRLLKETGQRPPVGIGKRIVQVQELFGKTYGVPKDEYQGVFDDLIDDDETFGFGQMMATALHLPGHTPDHMGYKIGGKFQHPQTTYLPHMAHLSL